MLYQRQTKVHWKVLASQDCPGRLVRQGIPGTGHHTCSNIKEQWLVDHKDISVLELSVYVEWWKAEAGEANSVLKQLTNHVDPFDFILKIRVAYGHILIRVVAGLVLSF